MTVRAATLPVLPADVRADGVAPECAIGREVSCSACKFLEAVMDIVDAGHVVSTDGPTLFRCTAARGVSKYSSHALGSSIWYVFHQLCEVVPSASPPPRSASSIVRVGVRKPHEQRCEGQRPQRQKPGNQDHLLCGAAAACGNLAASR
jgi:hypothetical protein